MAEIKVTFRDRRPDEDPALDGPDVIIEVEGMGGEIPREELLASPAALSAMKAIQAVSSIAKSSEYRTAQRQSDGSLRITGDPLDPRED